MESASIMDVGLSPRVRGNPALGWIQEQVARSIPACAGEPELAIFQHGRNAVYPRVCGGTCWTRSSPTNPNGLSPRVRGNHGTGGGQGGLVRSIPACAGEPRGLGVRVAGTAVYPRVCGGTRRSAGSRNRWRGLSPRVRGNRNSQSSSMAVMRSIPACAGEPATPSGEAFPYGVYPRVCGGTDKQPPGLTDAEGLSPRVRGNQRPAEQNPHVVGSIPACAGEPSAKSGRSVRLRVYPRVCGGTLSREMATAAAPGLSPRVRGNPSVDQQWRVLEGSIPACAGEPAPAGRRAARSRVYPRVCGGTLRRHPRRRTRVGSIPACAGEPVLAAHADEEAAVYPRVCGGTLYHLGNCIAERGLSPRVRGNRVRRYVGFQ